MAAPSQAAVAEFETRTQRQHFKSIHDLPETSTQPRAKPTPAEIHQWVDARPTARVVSGTDTRILIRCGFPEQATLEALCLAIAWFPDHVETLNVDGQTHRFLLEEVQHA